MVSDADPVMGGDRHRVRHPDGVISGVIAALTLFLPVLRVSRANGEKIDAIEKTVDKVDTKTAQVHVLVNQQHTDLINFNRALIRALREKGIAVPIDQSAAPTEEKP